MRLLLLISIISLTSHNVSYASSSINPVEITEYDMDIDRKALKRKHLVKYASSFIGTSYKSKKYSSSGFDCSGFVQHVFNHFDIDLDRSSKEMAKQGRRKSKPSEGDLVFFANGGRINHVAIVTKVDKEGVHIIHSTSSKGVITECLDASTYWKKRYAFAKDVMNIK